MSCCIASLWWGLSPAVVGPQWDLVLKSPGGPSQQRMGMERAGCAWGSGRVVACLWAAATRQPECCLDVRPPWASILVLSDQHKEENKCTQRRICLWEHLALRSGQRLLQELSGRGSGCGLQSTREPCVGLLLKAADSCFHWVLAGTPPDVVWS